MGVILACFSFSDLGAPEGQLPGSVISESKGSLAAPTPPPPAPSAREVPVPKLEALLQWILNLGIFLHSTSCHESDETAFPKASPSFGAKQVSGGTEPKTRL